MTPPDPHPILKIRASRCAMPLTTTILNIEGDTLQATTLETGPTEKKTAAPLAPRGLRFGLIKRLAVAIALTLMLSTALLSMMATPASARPYVNGLIGDCFNSGGDPNAFYLGGTYYVSCSYDDGTGWWTTD
jgi:hypothetical protein